jgi:signal transduction histidine kinase
MRPLAKSPLKRGARAGRNALGLAKPEGKSHVPEQSREGIGRLAEANRTLSMLYRLARSMPGGLDLGDVALAAMEEVRETLRSPAAILVVQKAELLSVAGSFGLRDPDEIFVETGDEAWLGLGSQPTKAWDLSELPSNLRPFFADYKCWLTTPLSRERNAVGLLMAACPDHRDHDANLLFLQHLADETALAVENARLFGKLLELSIEEERRRLARELHDGVAQSLTHIRMELEFLARRGNATEKSVQEEAGRLARVVAGSVRDVRRTIRELLPDPPKDPVDVEVRQ